MSEYLKPEISTLGEAVRMIQGSKIGKLDQQDPMHEVPANECTED
jgi:hypothetical protein